MDLTLAASVAAMISGAGACASALATWRTVREMRMQRELYCLPALACSMPTFSSENPDAEITVFNIGQGAARDVDIRVSAILDITPELERNLARAGLRLYESQGNFIVERTMPDGGIFSEKMSTGCIAHSSFIFPGAENGTRIRLPRHLHHFVGILAEHGFAKKDKAALSALKNAGLSVSMTFKDIAGKKISVREDFSMFDAIYDFESGAFQTRFRLEGEKQ